MTHDLNEPYVQMFSTAWRIGRERLRQQSGTLALLFAEAKKADEAIPAVPRFDLSSMTSSDVDRFNEYWEIYNTAKGTRDAYATAVVLVLDDILKLITRFYCLIPGASKAFSVGVNGKSLIEIVRATGNNIRHYHEWAAPSQQILRVEAAFDNVVTIATAVGRPIPTVEHISVMACNWSWPVLHAIGSGTFDGLVETFRKAMDEMLVLVGAQNDPYVLDEVAKDRLEC